jgi:hypothetical protein
LKQKNDKNVILTLPNIQEYERSARPSEYSRLNLSADGRLNPGPNSMYLVRGFNDSEQPILGFGVEDSEAFRMLS